MGALLGKGRQVSGRKVQGAPELATMDTSMDARACTGRPILCVC